MQKSGSIDYKHDGHACEGFAVFDDAGARRPGILVKGVDRVPIPADYVEVMPGIFLRPDQDSRTADQWAVVEKEWMRCKEEFRRVFGG